jgi:hypothetical protein
MTKGFYNGSENNRIEPEKPRNTQSAWQTAPVYAEVTTLA